MSAHKTTDRRKVLIGLSGGIIGAIQLPESWTKPVVDAVILPSHAATTDDSGTLPSENTATAEPVVITDFSGDFTFPGGDVSNTLIDNALSVLIPDAHAGRPVYDSGQMCIVVTPPTGSGASYTANVLIVRDNGYSNLYSGEGTVNGGATTLDYVSGCDPHHPQLSLNVTSVSNGGAVYTLDAGNGNVTEDTLPPGSVCPDTPICD